MLLAPNAVISSLLEKRSPLSYTPAVTELSDKHALLTVEIMTEIKTANTFYFIFEI